jgi:hypothetical protein
LTRCFRSYVLDCPMKYYSMVPDKAVWGRSQKMLMASICGFCRDLHLLPGECQQPSRDSSAMTSMCVSDVLIRPGQGGGWHSLNWLPRRGAKTDKGIGKKSLRKKDS